MIRVWDVPVRVVHWGLLLTVALGVWSGGHPSRAGVHAFAGHALVGLLAFRFVWGFVGTRWVRWRAFRWSAREVVAYARALLHGHAPPVTGHNPVASWAMLAGLALLVAIVVTGELALAGAEQQGPLAGALSVRAGLALAKIHGVLVLGLYAWIVIHLTGVAKESLRLREVLPWSMVTGYRRIGDPDHAVRAHRGVALALLLAGVLGGGRFGLGWWAATPEHPWLPYAPVAMAEDPTWSEACGECHLAFHPALLPARSWVRMLDEQAEDHFGEILALDPESLAAVRAFAAGHAAESAPTEWAARIHDAIPADASPQQVTELPWWVDRHSLVSDSDWEVAGGRIRCAACHLDAHAGSFEDGAMRAPTADTSHSRR